MELCRNVVARSPNVHNFSTILTASVCFNRRERRYGDFSPFNNKTYAGLRVKRALICLPDFNQVRNISIDLQRKSAISNLTENRPVGAELKNADGQT
jgi:hypothetical protein